MGEDELRVELGRAYRAIAGMYRKVRAGFMPDPTMLGYHSPTIAAALRFTDEGEMDGTAFFIGKPVEVMQRQLEG